MSRSIDKIIVHCAYTPASMDVDAATIDKWHREKGWMGIGYHYVIRRSGVTELGRDLERSGAHTKGQNSNSIGICMAGGMNDAKNGPALNFTDEQYDALRELIVLLKRKYPDATIHGHYEFASKTCPNFKVKKWFDTGELEETF